MYQRFETETTKVEICFCWRHWFRDWLQSVFITVTIWQVDGEGGGREEYDLPKFCDNDQLNCAVFNLQNRNARPIRALDYQHRQPAEWNDVLHIHTHAHIYTTIWVHLHTHCPTCTHTHPNTLKYSHIYSPTLTHTHTETPRCTRINGQVYFILSIWCSPCANFTLLYFDCVEKNVTGLHNIDRFVLRVNDDRSEYSKTHSAVQSSGHIHTLALASNTRTHTQSHPFHDATTVFRWTRFAQKTNQQLQSLSSLNKINLCIFSRDAATAPHRYGHHAMHSISRRWINNQMLISRQFASVGKWAFCSLFLWSSRLLSVKRLSAIHIAPIHLFPFGNLIGRSFTLSLPPATAVIFIVNFEPKEQKKEEKDSNQINWQPVSRLKSIHFHKWISNFFHSNFVESPILLRLFFAVNDIHSDRWSSTEREKREQTLPAILTINCYCGKKGKKQKNLWKKCSWKMPSGKHSKRRILQHFKYVKIELRKKHIIHNNIYHLCLAKVPAQRCALYRLGCCTLDSTLVCR